MKLRTTFIAILMLISIVQITTGADERTAARKELFGLLKERQKLFDNYSQSTKKKSGFFGNRTKNDMRESHATLQDIVSIDNKQLTYTVAIPELGHVPPGQLGTMGIIYNEEDILGLGQETNLSAV